MRRRSGVHPFGSSVVGLPAIPAEWDAFDLLSLSGVKVEVKSAAYVQSWAQSKPSAITFAIRPTLGWDASTNTSATVRARQADVYVSALLHHKDRSTLDALDIGHWEFYVLSAAVLNERCATQGSIVLSSLLKLKPRRCAHSALPEAIATAAG